jgi:hypothetical protein
VPFFIPNSRRADPTTVKALALAFRWKRLLDEGRYASISEIAVAEKIDRGYVGSILRLTLLALNIIEAILDGRQPECLGLPELLKPFRWTGSSSGSSGPSLLNHGNAPQRGAMSSAVRKRRMAGNPLPQAGDGIPSRKFQALRDLHFPELDLRIYPVALTLEGCIELSLLAPVGLLLPSRFPLLAGL